MTYGLQHSGKKPIWFILLAIISLFQSASMMSSSIFQLDTSFWLGIVYFIFAVGALIVAYALYMPMKWGWWFSILTYAGIYTFEAVITYSLFSTNFELSENQIIGFWFQSVLYDIIIWSIISMYVLSEKPYFTGTYDVAAHDGLFEAGRQYQEQKELAQKKRLSDLSHTTDETKKIVID